MSSTLIQLEPSSKSSQMQNSKASLTMNTNLSFERLTVDLGHEFSLYGKTTRVLIPRSSNGPDDCALDPVTHPECPKPYVRNFEGTIGFRVLTVLLMTPGGTVVPFYFQPTLGGADINGNPSLSSYQDYRSVSTVVDDRQRIGTHWAVSNLLSYHETSVALIPDVRFC